MNRYDYPLQGYMTSLPKDIKDMSTTELEEHVENMRYIMGYEYGRGLGAIGHEGLNSSKPEEQPSSSWMMGFRDGTGDRETET